MRIDDDDVESNIWQGTTFLALDGSSYDVASIVRQAVRRGRAPPRRDRPPVHRVRAQVSQGTRNHGRAVQVDGIKTRVESAYAFNA